MAGSKNLYMHVVHTLGSHVDLPRLPDDAATERHDLPTLQQLLQRWDLPDGPAGGHPGLEAHPLFPVGLISVHQGHTEHLSLLRSRMAWGLSHTQV